MSKCCILILGLFFSYLLLLMMLNVDERIGAMGASDLLLLDVCTQPPCLFGHSLENANYEQVEQILADSPLTRRADVERDGGTFNWYWPDTVLTTKLAPALSHRPYYYSNYVSFRQGHVDKVTLIFSMRLGELIAMWGEPETIIPLTYTHWGDMELLLDYGDSQGYFGVLLRCSEPELSPDGLVGFHFSARPGAFSREFEMPWSGYTDDLPDCTIFQP